MLWSIRSQAQGLLQFATPGSFLPKEGSQKRPGAQQHDVLREERDGHGWVEGCRVDVRRLETGRKGTFRARGMQVLEEEGDSETGEEQVDLRTLEASQRRLVAGQRENSNGRTSSTASNTETAARLQDGVPQGGV